MGRIGAGDNLWGRRGAVMQLLERFSLPGWATLADTAPGSQVYS